MKEQRRKKFQGPHGSHTPGPWTIQETMPDGDETLHFEIHPDNDPHGETVIADCIVGDSESEPVARANAERIVACVNACEGMPIPSLSIDALRAGYKQLLDDRRDLHAALLALRFLVDVSNIRPSKKAIAKWEAAAMQADLVLVRMKDVL